jgi:transcriptional regulator with XRE-family HTH domain
MAELARHLGVSVSYISDVELGSRTPLSTPRILAAATFLSADPKPLLEAAAKQRGSYELEATAVSETARRVGAALSHGWKRLTDEDLERIYAIVGSRLR